MDNLARQFEEELKEKMFRAKKECKYNPTRFNQMLARYGGVETAKRLMDTAIQTGARQYLRWLYNSFDMWPPGSYNGALCVQTGICLLI